MFLIFHVFQRISPYSRSYSVCVSFSRFSHFSCHIPGPSVYIYLFSRFSVFPTIFQVLPCEILIFLVCLFFRHITGPTVWVSNFPCFLGFLAIFQVLPCLFLIFLVCQFSQHIPDTTVHVSHFSRFSGFSPYYKSWCVHFSFFLFFTLSQNISGPTIFLIFQDIKCFLTYSSSHHVSFSFSFVSIFALCHVLQCTFIIFSFFSVSCHIPVPTM